MKPRFLKVKKTLRQRHNNLLKFSKESKNLDKSTCIKQSILDYSIKTFNRIGSSSKNGEVLKSCYINNSDECIFDMIVKKIPVYDIDLSLVKTPESKEALKYDVFSEIYFLKKISLLVEQKITQNVPIFFDWTVCKNCDFTNVHLIKYLAKHYPGSKGCILLLAELADTDLVGWFKYGRSSFELYSCFLQIFLGLYSIKKYFKIWHHDLHGGNVLVKKVPKGGYFEYLVGGKKILVPNLGFIFLLWDFGYARIPGVIEPLHFKSIYSAQNNHLLDNIKIVSQVYKTGPKIKIDGKLQHLGTFVYEHIKYIIDTLNSGNEVLPISEKSFHKSLEIQRDIIYELYKTVVLLDTKKNSEKVIVDRFDTDKNLE